MKESTDFVIEGTVLGKYTGTENKVTVPDGIKKIKRNAFYNSTIEQLDIPPSVANIEDEAFQGCIRLKNINADSQYFKIIENCLYDIRKDKIIFSMGKTNLEKLSGLKTIGKSVFSNMEVGKSLVIPEGVAEIGETAFWCCDDLEEVVIPSTIKEFNVLVFNYCNNLKKIVLTQGVECLEYATYEIIKNLKIIDVPDSVQKIKVLGQEMFRPKNIPAIYCNKGSYAHKFAVENGLKFKINNKKENML